MSDRSEVLRKAMRESGTSQSELARLSGVHQPSLSQFLSRKVDLSDDQIDRLLSCIGYRLEVTRRAIAPELTRAEWRSWKLHRPLSMKLTKSTLARWRQKIHANLKLLRANDIPELTDAQKMRWQAVISDVREVSARVGDSTATGGGRARRAQPAHVLRHRLMSCDIDLETLHDALHIPPDAGPYAEALERILRRMPDGWGRWISHDAGWYPIVAALDERLAAIDPDYVVHQVKEKFGTLNYYCEPSRDPGPKLGEVFCDIVSEAEHLSAVTCERCGEPGVLHRRNQWRKTLCAPCVKSLHYTSPLPGPADGNR